MLFQYDGKHLGLWGDQYICDITVSMSVLYGALLDIVIWILYFDWKRSTQILQTQWTEHLLLIQKINNKSQNNEPWTIKYAKICSNEKFLLSFAVLYWLLSLTILLYVVCAPFYASLSMHIH